MITDPELTLTRDTIAAIRAQLDALEAGLPTDPEPPTDEWPTELPSPTGADPVLFWTPEWQAIWYRMQTECERGETTLGATWFDLVHDNALGNRYADTGIWAMFLWQATGDPKWVDEARRKLEVGLWALTPTTSQISTNGVREWGMEWVLLVDWLWSGLTEEERTRSLAQLDMVMSEALGGTDYDPNAPVRTTDSDQTIGVYFTLAFYFLAFGERHQPAADFWADPEVGGFACTGENRNTLRNAVADYFTLGAGGEWIESGGYNWGTMKLVLMGYYGCLSAAGVDHFPEIAAWLPVAKFRTTYMITADFNDPLQWGDDQEPRAVILYKVVGLSMLFRDPVTNDLVHDLVARFGPRGSESAEPSITGARGFLRFDPYGPRTKRSTLPLHWFAHGQGILSARVSWEADTSHFFAHFPQDAKLGYVDHTVHYAGDLQLYRFGSWALTHPIAYGGRPNYGEGCNVMLHRNWGSSVEFRSALTHQTWPGSIHYLAGTTGGDVLPAKYYDPPPHWLHEYSRSVFWFSQPELPFARLTLQDKLDVLVVCDRSHVEDPLTIGKFERYSVNDQNKMKAALALRETIWHVPVEPIVDTGPLSATWPGARLVMLDDRELRVQDLTTAWPPPPPASPSEPTLMSERKWQVKALSQSTAAFETSLSVLVFGDGALSVLPVACSDGVRGVHLSRPDHDDVVVLFNIVPGPKTKPRSAANTWNPENRTLLQTARQATQPFSVSWDAEGPRTHLFLPERNYQVERVTVEGSGPQTYG